MEIWKKMWVGVFFWTQCIWYLFTYLLFYLCVPVGTVIRQRVAHSLAWDHSERCASSEDVSVLSESVITHSTTTLSTTVTTNCLWHIQHSWARAGWADICIFWHPGTLTLSPKRQCAKRLNPVWHIGCFTSVRIWQHWASTVANVKQWRADLRWTWMKRGVREKPKE